MVFSCLEISMRGEVMSKNRIEFSITVGKELNNKINTYSKEFRSHYLNVR